LDLLTVETVQQQPDALLNELCERFEQRRGVAVSVSTSIGQSDDISTKTFSATEQRRTRLTIALSFSRGLTLRLTCASLCLLLM